MININPSWILFFSTTILGFAIVISSNNWFIVWLGFELSLIGFLPLLSTNSINIESIINYFLVQASASFIYLFCFLIHYPCISIFLIILAITINLGMFPFYQWIPIVISGISWISCLILTTIQNLGPIFVIVSLEFNHRTWILVTLSASSIVISALLAYNQTFMRPLIAYSSISHTGWLISVSPINANLTLLYLTIYITLTIILFTTLHTININSIVPNGLHSTQYNNINIILISIAGIPPFPVFFIKLIVLNSLLNYTLPVLTIIVFACLSIYFYLNFIIPSLTNVNITSSNNNTNYTNLSLVTLLNLWILLII